MTYDDIRYTLWPCHSPAGAYHGGVIGSACRLVAAALIAFTVGPAVAAQQDPMTEERVRALSRQALAASPGEPTDAILALDDQVRQRWGDFESFPIALLHREDITIDLSAPYMSYRKTLGDYLRIDRPVADVPWVPDIVISVSPERLEAPDVTRIVVERAGRSVAPVESRLRPMTFMNGRGEGAVLHGGTVRFPLSAFAPGAPVTVTAITKDGSTVRATLDDAQLRVLR
jgi:hypothetical protein